MGETWRVPEPKATSTAGNPRRNPDEPVLCRFPRDAVSSSPFAGADWYRGCNRKEVCAPLRRAHLPRNEEAGWGSGYIPYHPQC